MSTTKPRAEIVFTEQFYYPDSWGGAQIPRDITCYLSRCGMDVRVICGSEPYTNIEGDQVEDPRAVGVLIRRVPRLFRGDIHHFKLLRQLWFYLVVCPVLILRRSPAAFVTQTNPPLLVPLVAFAAWIHRRPLIVIAQDLYPEVLFAHGLATSGSMLGRSLRAVFRWAYRRAAAVVSLGPVMTDRLTKKGVKLARIHTIPNWATGLESLVRGPENKLRSSWGLEGCFTIVYSGNIGVAHDVDTPIRAMREVADKVPQLRLLFIGGGSRLVEAKRLVNELDLTRSVEFRPLVTLAQMPHSMGLADVALVTLREGFEGLLVPSKALGYLARGLPTLYVGPPSDVQQMIEGCRAGICVRNGDVASLAKAILNIVQSRRGLDDMGSAAVRCYQAAYGRALGLERYRNLIAATVRASSEYDDKATS